MPTGATVEKELTFHLNRGTDAALDGRDQHPKHVEQIGIINKLLLLRLVGCLYHLYQ